MNNYDEPTRGHSTFDRDDNDAYQIDPTSYGHHVINDAIADDLQDRPIYDKVKSTYARIDGVSTE
jgi:hypothetical protein